MNIFTFYVLIRTHGYLKSSPLYAQMISFLCLLPFSFYFISTPKEEKKNRKVCMHGVGEQMATKNYIILICLSFLLLSFWVLYSSGKSLNITFFWMCFFLHSPPFYGVLVMASKSEQNVCPHLHPNGPENVF